jgi:superfamily II DNA helicase RecQ
MTTAYISSNNNDPDQQEKVVRGEKQIVFIGPELLMLNLTLRDMLRTPIYKRNLVAFVVDEVHCVTKW